MKTYVTKIYLCCVLLLTFLLSQQNVTPAQAQAFSCANVVEIPTTECQQLVNFYNSTNGASWDNKKDWLKNNTPCSWFGVSCADGRVSSIDLHNNELTGTIPNLTNLTQVVTLIKCV